MNNYLPFLFLLASFSAHAADFPALEVEDVKKNCCVYTVSNEELQLPLVDVGIIKELQTSPGIRFTSRHMPRWGTKETSFHKALFAVWAVLEDRDNKEAAVKEQHDAQEKIMQGLKAGFAPTQSKDGILLQEKALTDIMMPIIAKQRFIDRRLKELYIAMIIGKEKVFQFGQCYQGGKITTQKGQLQELNVQVNALTRVPDDIASKTAPRLLIKNDQWETQV